MQYLYHAVLLFILLLKTGDWFIMNWTHSGCHTNYIKCVEHQYITVKFSILLKRWKAFLQASINQFAFCLSVSPWLPPFPWTDTSHGDQSYLNPVSTQEDSPEQHQCPNCIQKLAWQKWYTNHLTHFWVWNWTHCYTFILHVHTWE